MVVALAYASGRLHAVHLLHLDVEEQDVVDRGVLLDDSSAVVEYGDGESFIILALIAIEIVEYALAACGVVFDYSDSYVAHA